MRGIRGQGSEVRRSRKAEGGSRSTIHYPLSTVCPSPVSRPLSPVPCRRGISLLEVLVSIGILSIGLCGVAALITAGKLVMVEANKSDRTGACGRAALHEVKVRGWLNWQYWAADNRPNAFVIDPLGVTATPSLTTLGPMNRVNIYTQVPGGTLLTAVQARDLFRWHDDLVFEYPTTPSVRPTIPTFGLTSEDTFSWFLTVVPQVVQGVPTGTYTVSVVVCYKRVLAATSESTTTIAASTYDGSGNLLNANGFPGFGIGGGSVVLDNPINGVKNDQWVMLAGGGKANWYRVVSAGPSPTTNLTLMGPDWDPHIAAALVVIDGVTGVYTATVQAN
jgi:hypothetical protein